MVSDLLAILIAVTATAFVYVSMFFIGYYGAEFTLGRDRVSRWWLLAILMAGVLWVVFVLFVFWLLAG